MWKRGLAFGPVLDDVADDFVADDLSGFERREIGRVIAGDHGLQAVGGGSAGWLAVVIAYGAEDEDSLEIDAPGLA
jgi:hypothetical protein